MQGGNKIVTGKVVELKSAGMIVQLEKNTNGWMPARELFPDYKIHSDFVSKAKDYLNKEIEVVEYDTDIEEKERLVSHIRTREDDPWKLVAGWTDKDLKVMEVTTVTKVFAYGLIKPGISAKVMLKDIETVFDASWKSFQRPFPGDEIAGFFMKDLTDEERRIVSLDISSYIKSDVSVSDYLLSPIAKTIEEVPGTEEFTSNYEGKNCEQFDLREVESILVVEDSYKLRLGLCDFLVNHGFDVKALGSYAESQKIIEKEESEFDLAIIDLHLLDKGNDYLGIEIAYKFQQQFPDARMLLISGHPINVEHPVVKKYLDELQINAFMEKPFGIQELYDVLTSYYRDKKILKNIIIFNSKPSESSFFKSRIEYKRDPQEKLEQIAELLRKKIHAEGVILFSIHPTTNIVEIEGKSDPYNRYYIKKKLDRSPVRDAAVMGELIFEIRASDNEPKHRWLKRAYHYESCIGVPVTTGSASIVSYALFAFHRDRNRFSEQSLNDAKWAASQMGEVLLIKAMKEELRQMKQYELMGKVYSSMGHDLTDSLPDEFSYENLKKQIEKNKTDEAYDNIKALKQSSQKAKRICEVFRAMARGQLEDVTDVNIARTTERCLENFPQHNLVVTFLNNIDPNYTIRMRGTGLELLIYNLILNSKDQAERLDSIRNIQTEIVIELTKATDEDGMDWAIFKIHDNGPGIHKKDFERVFDIHYTTKSHGCGMGLDICRNIAKSVTIGNKEGLLRVFRSILLCGTTFEFRLPNIRIRKI